MQTLRILILEDVASDAELMEDELKQAGIIFLTQKAATRLAFLDAMTAFQPDIILADYNLPGFDGLSALKIVMDRFPNIPFIFVSGALGEELAIDLLKQGATDYVLKNKLAKLGPSVKRALDELSDRRERQKAEDELIKSENRYRAIFDNAGTAMIIAKDNDTIVLSNCEFHKLTGYEKEEIDHKKKWSDFFEVDDWEKIRTLKKSVTNSVKDSIDSLKVCSIKRGTDVRDVIVNLAAIADTSEYVVSFLDITEKKKTALKLKDYENEIHVQAVNLEETNTALKVLLRHRDEDQTAIEQKIVANINKLVFPYLEKLETMKLNEIQLQHLDVIRTNLNSIISPFLRNLTIEQRNLTPREIQIAGLVKDGKTTKEITEILNISSTAIDFHRKNIRLKLGIKNKRTNLRSLLLSLSK